MQSLNFSAIFDDTKPQPREPIVQCVQIKPLPPQQNQQERYRAVFSDISNYVQTMLATRELERDLSNVKMLKHLPTRPTRVHRKQSSGYQRFTPKRMLRSLEIFSSELGQGKKVCDSILP